MKIGDKVKIKKFSYIYTTYTDMFKKMGFENPNEPKRIEMKDKHLFKDVIFTIFAKENHADEPRKVFGIKDENGNQFLFGKKGLKLIN